MAEEKPDVEDRFPPKGSPLTAAAILLAIYIAMYLTVAGLVRLASPPDAYAAVPARAQMKPRTAAETATTVIAPSKRNADANSD